MNATRILTLYYAATVLFVLFDVGFGVNVRLAFLDPWPGLRALYYGFCFACLALIMWRPSWSTAVGTVESLVTLVALILSMGIRVMVPTDAIFAQNAAFLTVEEVVNFIIAGFAAYFAWTDGLKRLRADNVL